MTQQEKKEFAVFKQNYELTIDNISENMNSLLKTADEINTDELVENVDKLVFQSKSRYEIMNMVHHIRAFDDETYRHSLNVAMINSVFAGWLGMTEYERKQLILCGLMHDVGKLLISKDILRKPGRLTEEEYEQIKKHPLLGYEKMKDKNIPLKLSNKQMEYQPNYNIFFRICFQGQQKPVFSVQFPQKPRRASGK